MLTGQRPTGSNVFIYANRIRAYDGNVKPPVTIATGKADGWQVIISKDAAGNTVMHSKQGVEYNPSKDNKMGAMGRIMREKFAPLMLTTPIIQHPTPVQGSRRKDPGTGGRYIARCLCAFSE
jgi:hypothetical protein